MLPVPLSTVIETLRAFSTFTPQLTKSVTPPKDGAADFVGILNSLDVVPHDFEEAALPTVTKPDTMNPSESNASSPKASTPFTTEVADPVDVLNLNIALQGTQPTAVQEKEQSATPRKPRLNELVSSREESDQITSTILTAPSPTPSTVNQIDNRDALSAMWNIPVPDGTPTPVEKPDNNRSESVESSQPDTPLPDSRPVTNGVRSTYFSPNSTLGQSTVGSQSTATLPELSAKLSSERLLPRVVERMPERVVDSPDLSPSRTSSMANTILASQINLSDAGRKGDSQSTAAFPTRHSEAAVETSNIPLRESDRFTARRSNQVFSLASQQVKANQPAVSTTQLQNAGPYSATSDPSLLVLSKVSVPSPAWQSAINVLLPRTLPSLPEPINEPQLRSTPADPPKSDREETSPRVASEKRETTSVAAPAAPSVTLPSATLIPGKAVPPQATNSSSPAPQTPKSDSRTPTLGSRQPTATLSQSTFDQPTFTAFEARLSPRTAQSNPLGDVPPPLTTTAATTNQPAVQHSELPLQSTTAETQAQTLSPENDGPKPKSGSPVQPTIFESKQGNASEPVTAVTRPSVARRQEPTERQVLTTEIQTPQSQTVMRPQLHQQSKSDTPASAPSLPDLNEPAPSPAGPARDISFRLGNTAADSVNVKIADRAGQIHVAVQSGDSAVAQALQSNVKELAGKLESSGFHTETFIPGRTQPTADWQQNSAFQDFQQNRRAPEQEQRIQKKRRSAGDGAFSLIPNQENQ